MVLQKQNNCSHEKFKKIKNRLTNDSIASNRIFFKYTLFWKVLHVYLLGQKDYFTFCIKQLIWKIMQLSQIMYANTKLQESSIVIRKILCAPLWCILRGLVVMTRFKLVSVKTSKLFHFLFKIACISLVWCYKNKITVPTKSFKKLKIGWQMIL